MSYEKKREKPDIPLLLVPYSYIAFKVTEHLNTQEHEKYLKKNKKYENDLFEVKTIYKQGDDYTITTPKQLGRPTLIKVIRAEIGSEYLVCARYHAYTSVAEYLQAKVHECASGIGAAVQSIRNDVSECAKCSSVTATVSDRDIDRIKSYTNKLESVLDELLLYNRTGKTGFTVHRLENKAS